MGSLRWLDHPILRDPVALVAFEGWGDAGESASAAVSQIVESLDATPFAVIDPEDHYDFQVRRPTVEMDEAGVREISWPRNTLYAIRHGERDLVLVLGEEPHFRWKSFTADLVEALGIVGVTRAITLGAFVGQVAHTLPVPLVGSASRPDALAIHGLLPSGYEGPTGILGVLNQVLGSHGIDVISVWAAVPHYLSNQEYPPATEALAMKASELAGVSFDVSDLVMATRMFLSTVEEAIEGNEELVEYIATLEDDASADRSPERLVEEIERFLKDQ